MYNKYFSIEKVKELIDAYIELAQCDDPFDNWDASSTLHNIFSADELKELGIFEYVNGNLGF